MNASFNTHPVQQKRNGKTVLDIKGLLYRCYFQTKDRESSLVSAEGKPLPKYSTAFETFLNEYFDVIVEEQGFAPVDIIAAWDAGNQYRKSLYAGYKKKRHEKEKDPVFEAEFEKLTKLVQQFLAAVGAIQVSVPGVEADDVCAYLCGGIKPFVNLHTVDQDLIQLVSDTVTIFVGAEDRESIPSEAGPVPAHLIALHHSLIGDPSDEYPGVKGFGQVTFRQLIEAFGFDGLEELLPYVESKSAAEFQELAHDLNDKNIWKIAEDFASWKLCFQLAKLHPEICYGFRRKKKIEPTWFKRVPDEVRLTRILTAAGLPYLIEKYRTHCSLQYLMVERDTVEDIFEDIHQNVVAYDYETYDPNPQKSLNDANPKGDYVNVLHATPTGASFCFGTNLQYVVYVPVWHKDTYNFTPETLAEVLKLNSARVAQNAAFEKTVTDLKVEGGLESNLCDTAIMASHVDENSLNHLKELSKKWLGYEQTTYKELMEATGAAQMNDLTGRQVLQYGCDDALVTAHLWSLFDLIAMVEGSDSFIYENEFHFVDVMARGFQKGIPIDLDRLSELEAQDQQDLDTKVKALHTSLAKHCMASDTKAVDTYMQEITPFLKAKANEKATRKELEYESVFSDLYNQEQSKWLTLSRYTPVTERTRTEDFIPTPKKIEKLLKLAGMERVGMPTSLAGSRVTEWLASIELQELSEEERTVLQCFGKAVKHFKTRDPAGLLELSNLYYDLQVKTGAVKTEVEGDDLNTSSDNQMLSLLYLKLSLPIRHRTIPDRGSFRDKHGLTGAPSASDKALEYALAEDAEVGTWQREVLETLREIKTIETRFRYYYRPYPQWVHEDSDRIHPQFRNCGTNSRRPTSTGPNALQVAKGAIRQVYLPLEKGHILVVPDWSAQELRLLASESLDPALLNAFLGDNSKDVHALTASSFAAGMVKRLFPELVEFIDYGPSGKEMTYECFDEWLHASDPEDKDFLDAAKWLRNKRAKAVNFLVSYCGTAGTLSTNLLIPKEEAQDLLDSMFDVYTGIRPFQEGTTALAAKQGFVRSVFGPVRHAKEELLSDDTGLSKRVERQLINYRMQGVASDILKVVLRQIAETNLLEDTESYVIATVYDEILCSVPLAYVAEFCPRLQKIMDITPPGHKVPMVSEFKLGFTWGDLVEIGTDTSSEAITAGVLAARKKVEARRAGE